jgi:hypothetical protein
MTLILFGTEIYWFGLLGLRVQILLGAWLFVLCVLYSNDKRQSQDNQDKDVWIKYTKKKNPSVGILFLKFGCVVFLQTRT